MTPLKEPFQPFRWAELVVSAERHRHLDQILSYVRDIHDFIDPDMFNISRQRLEDLSWCFQRDEVDHTGFTVTVSYEDLFWLQIITDAAYEYSLRRSPGRRVDDITNVGFDALLTWLAQAEEELFRSGPASG